MIIIMNARLCLSRKKELLRYQGKFCSNQCQSDTQYSSYIRKWKNGQVDGGRGISTRNISKHLKKYLYDKYEGKCSQCGWNKLHPKTNLSPLEVDHIDGDSENNNENNLRILCPNCHSLTSNFRNHNRGKGRLWRKLMHRKD